jgi:hypothetical protein
VTRPDLALTLRSRALVASRVRLLRQGECRWCSRERSVIVEDGHCQACLDERWERTLASTRRQRADTRPDDVTQVGERIVFVSDAQGVLRHVCDRTAWDFLAAEGVAS